MKGRRRILIVDDLPSNIKILNGFLQEEYDIRVATNGADALKLAAAAEQPDLILLDIMMPGMDGYDVCSRLKSDDKTRKIPVIFITALAEEEDERRGLDLGAVDYITKPFRPPIVKARVSNHLELKRHQEHLEELVEQRTAELTATNTQLRQEIKERRQVEEALRESEKSLAEAQRIALLGNWAMDLISGELQWSGEACRIFGVQPQRFGDTFKAFLDYVHPEDRAFVDEAFSAAVRDESIFDIEHRIIKPDGNMRYVHQKGVIKKDKADRAIKFFGTAQDVTERRNLERMKHGLAMAREIQQHLLPQEDPKIEGFDIFGTSLYCEETGGDYFDFIEQKGKLGVAIGDVTGHGIGPAVLMAMAKGILRVSAERFGSDLTRLFQSMNLHLISNTDPAVFMTLFYGVLNAEDRTLCWNSAGQGPVYLLRNLDLQIEELHTTGIPLGILEDAVQEPIESIDLKSGDVVLIGTDGIWEARNARGELFGTERLRNLLLDCASQPASKIFESVTAAVEGFCAGARQEDDITLIIIKTL